MSLLIAFLFTYIASQVPHRSHHRTQENEKEVGSVNPAGQLPAAIVATLHTLAGFAINVGSTAASG